jgi:hypothetical protein
MVWSRRLTKNNQSLTSASVFQTFKHKDVQVQALKNDAKIGLWLA